jgi:hypothetical protein
MSTAVLLLGSCNEPVVNEPIPYDNALDMSQLMHQVIEPAADVIWSSAGTIDTAEGRQDLAPTTEMGWLATKSAAAMLVESGNLLKLPARSESRSDWVEIATGLSSVGHKLMDAAEKENADTIFEEGGNLYNVCVACHTRYWIKED